MKRSESLCEFLYPVVRTRTDVNRDRKREASTPVGEPDLKKPKLDDVEVDLASSAAAPISYGMEDVIEAGKQPLQKSEAKGKEKGDGAFKESPYAYLSPDDPILQQCR